MGFGTDCTYLHVITQIKNNFVNERESGTGYARIWIPYCIF